MSSVFLLRFAMHLVRRLVAEDLLELRPGSEEDVIAWVADHLGRLQHESLIRGVSQALVTCEAVEELWADDDDLKRVIAELDPAAARG